MLPYLCKFYIRRVSDCGRANAVLNVNRINDKKKKEKEKNINIDISINGDTKYDEKTEIKKTEQI